MMEEHGEMKPIIMAIPYGTDARNLLRTDVLKTLKSNGLRVIILSPAFNEEYFVKEFTDENTTIERLYTQRQSILAVIFRIIRLQWLANYKFSDSTKIKYNHGRHIRREGKIKNKSLKQKIASAHLPAIILSPLSTNKKFREFLRRVDLLLFPDRFYKEIFDKYNPALVFVAFPFLPPIFPVLKRAMQNKVPSIAFISSWDNLSSRGELPVKSDKLIVWNEINKREAVELHGYSPNDVFISGAPQFDAYFRGGELSSKKEFFKEIGADMDKKLLVYTTTGTWISKADPEIIDIIKGYIEEDKFSFPCQLLVRVHPRAPFELYECFKGCKDIILERPGRLSNAYSDNWDPTRKDLVHLANTMKHCDGAINIASTITIEASIFDTPIVNIEFDGYQKKTYLDSVIRYYDYTHYKNIVKTGGVRIAKNKEELLKYINMYLENPKIDSKGRKRIVKEQCYYTDGQSGERVAKHILEYLKESENKK